MRKIDDDTLLILIGDHGMDRRGDHGGDSTHETSAAMWIYSKAIPLSQNIIRDILPRSVLTYATFPGIPSVSRSIQQIDLVPTLSLLLGLPIPFNNLGTPIPELFLRDSAHSGSEGKFGLLRRANELTAKQIDKYLQVYRASVSGGELDAHWNELQDLFAKTKVNVLDGNEKALNAMFAYNRRVLGSCRELWAQFDSQAMLLGLAVLFCSVICSTILFNSSIVYDNASVSRISKIGASFVTCGPLLGVVSGIVLKDFSLVQRLVFSLFASAIGLSGFIVIPALQVGFEVKLPFPAVIGFMHAVSFFSNSFVFWEDRIVPFLLATTVISQVIIGIPTSLRYRSPGKPIMTRLHWRVIGFASLALVCTRLMGLSTVCREEQQPYCHVTFYAASSVAAPPILMLLVSLFTAWYLPSIILRILHVSRSDSGPARPFINYLLRGSLLGGCTCWLVEYAETMHLFGSTWGPILRATRTVIARFMIGGGVLVGYYTWTLTSLCLDVVPVPTQNNTGKLHLQVVGFANAMGSSYLLFLLVSLGLVWCSTQLTGQVILALGMAFTMSWLEVVDSLRDLRRAAIMDRASGDQELREKKFQMQISKADEPLFAEVLPLCLLAMLLYFGTGHQSTLQSLQWKTAFLLTENVVYPFSPVLVAINSLGPISLVGIALPLLATWNVTPSPYKEKINMVEKEALRVSLAAISYFGLLLLGSATSAALLRRHLMVWKVFAPRFMAGAAALIAVDLGVAFALFWGLPSVFLKVNAFAKLSQRI